MSALMNKYLSEADISTLETLTKALKNDNITVTCMGLYNHGKSTLLNALVKDFENETFKTADVRETSKNKSVKRGNITFVDTPGLNAEEYDDKRVMDAIKKSDINLFVHTVTTGEFAGKEMEFLENVKKHWKNPQEFIERTIFVVSRVDKANSSDDIENTIKRMEHQILNIFNSNTKIIPVSAIRYIKGKKENKNLMVEKSNIELLENTIEKQGQTLLNSIKLTRKKRLTSKYNNLIKEISSKENEQRLELLKQKKDYEETKLAQAKKIEEIEKTLKNMYTRLR